MFVLCPAVTCYNVFVVLYAFQDLLCCAQACYSMLCRAMACSNVRIVSCRDVLKCLCCVVSCPDVLQCLCRVVP